MKAHKIVRLALVLIVLVLFSCKKKDDPPNDLIVNGNVESGFGGPNGWRQSPLQDMFTLSWTDEVSSSGTMSLVISAQVADAAKFAYWYQVIYDNIPHEKELTLKVRIKCNLTGNGASIAIRGDNELTSLQFVTTEWLQTITGNFDWKEFEVKLESVDPSVKSLLVFLVYLPNTRGEVYFDDISLNY